MQLTQTDGVWTQSGGASLDPRGKVTPGCEGLHNGELHNLYSSPNNIKETE